MIGNRIMTPNTRPAPMAMAVTSVPEEPEPVDGDDDVDADDIVVVVVGAVEFVVSRCVMEATKAGAVARATTLAAGRARAATGGKMAQSRIASARWW